MTTQLVSTNTLTFTSGVAAALQARMAVPPLPLDFLSMLGLGVTSDVTATSDTAATRTITLFAAPATTAVLTPVLVPGDGDGAPIQKVTVGTPGGSYVVPPVLTAVQGAGGAGVVRRQAGSAAGHGADAAGAVRLCLQQVVRDGVKAASAKRFGAA